MVLQMYAECAVFLVLCKAGTRSLECMHKIRIGFPEQLPNRQGSMHRFHAAANEAT